MSEDAPTFREQSQPRFSDGGNGGPSKGKGKASAVQTEMMKELDEIVTNFIPQNSSTHDACRFLNIALDENPSLTTEQCSDAYRMYGQRREEAYAAGMWAIARGECVPNPPGGADAPGE